MTKACPKCNQMNPPAAVFCLNCAASLGPPPPPMPPNGVSKQGGPGQKAIIALILAAVALFCCGPFAGIPAAIVGWMELDAIKNGRSPADGKWMAMVGLWGGIAATVIHGGLYLLWVLASMMGGATLYV
ncbi:MAG: hypothetical protein ACRD6X_18900 [Pyrinomonadaceae bacterium]